MATVTAKKSALAPRIIAFDHATMPSSDIMADLEFYEKFLGASLMPRTPGEPRSSNQPAPFVNLKTERIKAGRFCNCFIRFAGGSGFGLFLQPEFPPLPQRLLQGIRYGMALEDGTIDAAAKAFEENGIEFLGPVTQEPESPIDQSIYFRDPSGNGLEVSSWRAPPKTKRPQAGGTGLIAVANIAHIAVDVADLDEAEDFYGNYVLDCAVGNLYILYITLRKGIYHDKERARKIRA